MKIRLGSAMWGLAISSGLLAMGGCAVKDHDGIGSLSGYDYIQLGTSAGINANADMMNGLIKTAKETRRDQSQYFGFRQQQEPEVTKREVEKVRARSKSLFDGLFQAKGE